MHQKGGSAVELLLTLLILALILLLAETIYLPNEQHLQNAGYENFVSQQLQFASQSLMAGDTRFISAWQQSIAMHLPQGHAEIKQTAGWYFLNITWFDRFAKIQRSQVYSVLA